MALQLAVYDLPANARANKIAIAAALAGVKVEVVHSVKATENMAAYKLNCHPLGANPTLQTEQGYLFESGAIVRHMGRLGKATGIYGMTDFEASSIDAWIDLASTELDGAIAPIMVMGAGLVEKNDAVLKNATETVLSVFEGVEAWLEIRTWLVGERITIADAAFFVTIDTFLRYAPAAAALEAYKLKNIIRYYLTVLHHPKVQEGLKSRGHDGLIPAKPKEEKAPAAPKKEEKKEKPAAAAAAAEDDFDDAPKEEKKKNPLDDLPPSSFVLDAFKREYSNTDTRKVAAPYFFEKFDPQGFTCFWCNYKYNEENKMTFMTGNLIRGWFQRMDHVRKYAFGCVMIAGEDTKHDITGFWVFRGKGLPEIVADVDDTELFEWTEIPDINAERAKITDYLAWDGETFKEKPVLEGRCYK